MDVSFLAIALMLIAGSVVPLAMRAPELIQPFGRRRGDNESKRFSPNNTLFIIGPGASHPACRMQRRLLKPALAALIRDDVAVMEVYGENRPRKNGEPLDWLDVSLLRRVMGAETGFFVIYVDAHGRTRLRSEAPVVTGDLLAKARLEAPASLPRRRSAALRRLSAA